MTPTHQVLLVGRSRRADIRVDHPTVSRLHLELVLGRGGEIHVADRSSSNGTRVRKGGTWRTVTAGMVSRDSRLRLGDARVAVSDLLRRAEALSPGPSRRTRRKSELGLPSGRVRRDPETGELIPC